MDVDVVKSDGDDWNQQDGEDQHGCDPERRQAERHSERAQVLAARYEVAVDQQCHGEEERYTAKDDDVIEDCPVRSIKSDLLKKNKGRHDSF